MKNGIFRDVSVDSLKIQYDTQCKKVLANKIILAWILKYTMKEFQSFTVEEIAKSIEGNPEIGEYRVNPGESNVKPEKITGSNTEDKVPDEGSIYYDIRFYVHTPHKKKRTKILINVEAQRSFYPGYSIVTRGIFYGARMISAQLDTEFKIPNYDDMKKVCSIWICMNAPDYIGNAIAEYSIGKNDIVPGVTDIPREYDKLSVIMVCLNRRAAENENRLTEMLNILLSTKIAGEEKAKILQEEFEIPMEQGEEKEMDLMCNLSEYVEECGIQKGIEQGIRTLILSLRGFNIPNDIIFSEIRDKYQLSEKDAQKYMEETIRAEWNGKGFKICE